MKRKIKAATTLIMAGVVVLVALSSAPRQFLEKNSREEPTAQKSFYRELNWLSADRAQIAQDGKAGEVIVTEADFLTGTLSTIAVSEEVYDTKYAQRGERPNSHFENKLPLNKGYRYLCQNPNTEIQVILEGHERGSRVITPQGVTTFPLTHLHPSPSGRYVFFPMGNSKLSPFLLNTLTGERVWEWRQNATISQWAPTNNQDVLTFNDGGDIWIWSPELERPVKLDDVLSGFL